MTLLCCKQNSETVQASECTRFVDPEPHTSRRTFGDAGPPVGSLFRGKLPEVGPQDRIRPSAIRTTRSAATVNRSSWVTKTKAFPVERLR
jgi:hypothetical protein